MSSRSPYATRLSTFRAPGWGTLAVLPPCRWRNATSRKLVPFSHRSASRIFIRHPAASPRRWSPKTVTSSSMVGRSEPGYDLGPALSFKDLHHPGWGGGRAEPELCLLRGSAGHLLPQTSTTRGWSTASVVSISTLGSLAQLALARLPVPPPAARAVVAPRAPEDRPRRRALLGRRSCSGAVLPLPRYGASVRRSVLRSSGRIRVGICRWADGFRRRR
jgi:hypothetical protein